MDNNFGWNLEGDFIAHYGTKRHSGRYPWGSGEKWRKIRAGVKNAGDKIKKVFGGKNRVDTSAIPKNWDQMTPAERAEWSNKHQDALLKGESSTQKLTSADSDGDKTVTTTPKTETPAKPDKKTALESGNREDILKVFQESSNEEIQRAINKANLMDSLNKSINDAKPKEPEQKSAEQQAKEDRDNYIKEALGSGDYNRIMEVATDKSVSNQDLQNALNKMSTIQNAQEKNSASNKFFEKADRFKNAVDKSLGYYDTAANLWNTIAVNYNNTADVKSGKTQPLGMLLAIPKNNNNQQKQNNQQQGPPKPQQQQNQNQQNNQQQVQNNQKQQQQQTAQNQPTQKQTQQVNQQQSQQNTQSQSTPKQEVKQPAQETKQKIQQTVQKVSNKKMVDYEDSLFPNDDNYSPKTSSSSSSSKSNDLATYYKSLSKQDIPSWMYKQSLSDYSSDYTTDYDYLDHSSLGRSIFDFIAHADDADFIEFLAHYGVPHGKGPGRGSGRYAWGSGKKNKTFGEVVKNQTKNSLKYMKNISKEGFNPWESPKQMELLLEMANNSKKYYESQLNSSNKVLAALAKQILDKPIKGVEFLENHKDGKLLLGWYSRLALKNREEYSQKIYDMKLDSKPDQDLIDFMLMLSSNDYYMSA